MRTLFTSLLLASLTLFACKKSTDTDNKNTVPPELVGQWVRGEFDMAEFERYQGNSVMHSALTTGAFEFLANGQVRAYSVSFPTDAQGGCNPQVLSRFDGVADHTVAGRALMTFSGGSERKFYQQCPGKTNTQRNLSTNDFSGPLTCYWSIETSSGKTLLAIRYDRPDNPKIYFEKKNW